jgi:hypothetical protein
MLAEGVVDQPLRAQFEVLLDEHCCQLNGCLDGLTEKQARPVAGSFPDHLARPGEARDLRGESLVRRNRHLQITRPDRHPRAPDESSILHDTGAIAAVQQAHREACEASRWLAAWRPRVTARTLMSRRRQGSTAGLPGLIARSAAIPARMIWRTVRDSPPRSGALVPARPLTGSPPWNGRSDDALGACLLPRLIGVPGGVIIDPAVLTAA